MKLDTITDGTQATGRLQQLPIPRVRHTTGQILI